MGLGQRFSFIFERDDVRDIGFRIRLLRLNNSEDSRKIEIGPRDTDTKNRNLDKTGLAYPDEPQLTRGSSGYAVGAIGRKIV